MSNAARKSQAPSTQQPALLAEDITKRFVKRLDLAGKIAQRLGSSIREETVGKGHPDYATSLFHLANLYYLTRRFEEAEKLRRELVLAALRRR